MATPENGAAMAVAMESGKLAAGNEEDHELNHNTRSNH
jgi:hypothetical protein